MAIDRKYGRVTLEHGDIGADEPVVVFRAQDELLPEVLAFYTTLCEERGSPKRHINGLLETTAVIVEWQAEHPTQVPQSAAQAP